MQLNQFEPTQIARMPFTYKVAQSVASFVFEFTSLVTREQTRASQDHQAVKFRIGEELKKLSEMAEDKEYLADLVNVDGNSKENKALLTDIPFAIARGNSLLEKSPSPSSPVWQARLEELRSINRTLQFKAYVLERKPQKSINDQSVSNHIEGQTPQVKTGQRRGH